MKDRPPNRSVGPFHVMKEIVEQFKGFHELGPSRIADVSPALSAERESVLNQYPISAPPARCGRDARDSVSAMTINSNDEVCFVFF